MKAPAQDSSLTWLTAGFLALFGGLAARLVYIQGFRPETPRYTLGGTPPQTAYQPAPRGEILDVRGERLVHSQFSYDLKANPVVIGPHAKLLAAHLAPILSTSAAKLELAFQIRPELRWKTETVTNRDGRTFSYWTNTFYTNQSVLIATNLSFGEWTHVRTNLLRYMTPEEVQLKQTWAAIEYKRTNSPPIRWWDLAARYHFRREINLAKRDTNKRLKPVRTENETIRKTAIAAEIIERRIRPHDDLADTILGTTTNGLVPLVEYRTATDFIRMRSRELPPEVRGADGIERQFDDELRGIPGKTITRRRGTRELANSRELDLAPHPGANIRLTIDANLQYVAEDALHTGMERLRPNWMSAIMVRPSTGEILALANCTSPDYIPPGVTNPAAIRRPIRRNHAVSELVEPGSTFKLVTYAAALELHKITPESKIDCQGGIWQPPAGRRKPVADARGHKLGVATAEEAFALSSNVGAAKLGFYELWDPLAAPRKTPLVKYAEAFGFTRKTGILCGGEPFTRIPAWDGIGTQIILSYGYGIYATPLQVAMAYAAVANDGVLMEPMLVKAVGDEGSGQHVYQPRQVGRVVRPETARQLVQLMTAVVSPKGTGKDAAMEDYTVAGKTGTANKMTRAHMVSGANAHFSTFVGFFPAENPEICLLVCADEPTGTDGRAAYGAACVPVFKQIARETASYLTIPPSPRSTEQAVADSSASKHH